LHLLFSILDAPAAGCSMSMTGHHTVAAVCGAVEGAMLVPSLPMVMAHLAATVATAWLLSRGEAWLWRAVHAVFEVPAAVSPPDARRERVVVRADVLGSGRVAGPDAARGPPAAAALTF
jgi:hypothetical protein